MTTAGETYTHAEMLLLSYLSGEMNICKKLGFAYQGDRGGARYLSSRINGLSAYRIARAMRSLSRKGIVRIGASKGWTIGLPNSESVRAGWVRIVDEERFKYEIRIYRYDGF